VSSDENDRGALDERPRVLVTGAGGGIGEGIATVLAARGWLVLVNDIDADAAVAVAQHVGGIAVPGDVDDDELVARAVDAAGGTLHGLVNNAGVIRRAPLAELTRADIDMTLGVNLRAVMLRSRDALTYLSASSGAIVNLTSMTAETPLVGAGAYSASKAGVIAFTRQAAIEWGPLGVRVNAIAPGMIRSAMSGVYTDPVISEARRAMVPAGRIGEPADAGAVAAFLLGPDSAYVSGETILVDGGMTYGLAASIPQAR
jgi:3-oxoacyl-[acyl-carrier protein] reductase